MKRVLVGLSGGVDSSVTAVLLQKQGYEVVGVTMNVWDKKGEMSQDAINDARAVAEKLNIEYHVLDFKDIFKEKVIDYFANEYISGRTPNPCIACNRFVKFEALLNAARSMFNCEYIATGHYAKVDYDEATKRYFLRKSETVNKDQTYALYRLTQEQLAHTIMPLGDYEKEEVRKIAEENNLINAKRRDSQEICFVEDNDYSKFIQENYNYIPKKGNFVDINGKVLGQHKGILNYTIGQRRGLGLALGTYQYVIKLDMEKNEVVVGDEEYLFNNTLICDDVNFMTIDGLDGEMKVTAKIRYSAKDVPAVISRLSDGKVKVVFDEKQRAITAGQAVVFYDNDKVVGGGTIIEQK